MANAIIIEDENLVELVVENGNSVELVVEKENAVNVDTENLHFLGIDPSNANAEEQDVVLGKTFYSGNNDIRVGSLDINIVSYMLQDLNEISMSGGSLPSYEEYEMAENELQKIYCEVMGME